MTILPIVTGFVSLIGVGSLSVTPDPRRPLPPVVQLMSTGPGRGLEPVIFSVPDILSVDETSSVLSTIESALQWGDMEPTTSYQEDIFSKEKWEEEDARLASIVQPFLDESLIPPDYAKHLMNGYDPNAALQAFVYAVTKYQDRLSESDIILGANVIQRRQAIERWKSEEGTNIMKLSLDHIDKNENDEVNWDSFSLGRRHELPPELISRFEHIIPRLLFGRWTVQEATLVKYSAGDAQVPHVDPCDATIIICLKSCDEGGDTCFPLMDPPLRLKNREGSGILFFSSNKVAGDAGRNTLSLHHGGKVVKGEKMIIQLMLDFRAEESPSDLVTWADLVVGSS
ncbi:hypothetical protein ACHAWF_013253 [Thalassiosira exigua]